MIVCHCSESVRLGRWVGTTVVLQGKVLELRVPAHVGHARISRYALAGKGHNRRTIAGWSICSDC